MQPLKKKKKIKTGVKPLQQLLRRYAEKRNHSSCISIKPLENSYGSIKMQRIKKKCL